MCNIIIEITKRYCSRCGKQLLLIEEETSKFDTKTGERITKFRQMCPDFISKKSAFLDKYAWLDHDSVTYVDLVRVNKK